MVSTNQGYIYLLWTDFQSNSIRLSRSVTLGATWSVPETGATATTKMCTGKPLRPGVPSGLLNGGVRAPSLPVARFNWVATKIGVVWHECDAQNHADVYFATKSLGGWSAKVRVNDNVEPTATDQFTPALDFDGYGNYLVTFYDRRDDQNNDNYHLYAAKINSSGSPLSANYRLSDCPSTPYAHSYAGIGVWPFLGDYHEAWFDTFPAGNRVVSAWVGAPTPACNPSVSAEHNDVYLSAIQP